MSLVNQLLGGRPLVGGRGGRHVIHGADSIIRLHEMQIVFRKLSKDAFGGAFLLIDLLSALLRERRHRSSYRRNRFSNRLSPLNRPLESFAIWISSPIILPPYLLAPA